MQRGIDWKVNLGVVVLGVVFVISLAGRAGVSDCCRWRCVAGGGKRSLPLLYFVAVGLGYILVEIAFIQRFVLFLGHPTYALTVVIFLLLLSSGAGSLLSRRWLSDTRAAGSLLLLIAAIAALTPGVLPGLLSALIGLPFVVKLAVSAVVLGPLGFAMGMPFPTGLRALASTAATRIARLGTRRTGAPTTTRWSGRGP